MPPLQQFMALAAAAAMGCALLLLATIAAARALRRQREARLAQLTRGWRTILEEAAHAEAPVPLPAIGRHDLADFLALWARMQDEAQPAAAERLGALLAANGLDARVMRQLAHPVARLRLRAIAAAGRMRDARAWPTLERLAREPGPVTSFAAARALIRIDPRRGLDSLAASIPERRDWPLARLASMFESLGAAVVTPPLVTMLLRRPRPGLDRVVKLARFGDRARISTIVRGWLGSNTDPEVLIAGLDYIDHPSDLPWAHGAAGHAEWRVRMAAARALARVGRRDELAPLLELLRDPVWWVRYHAAQGLTRLEGLEPFELDTLRENARDAFAADMLGQALAERRWT